MLNKAWPTLLFFGLALVRDLTQVIWSQRHSSPRVSVQDGLPEASYVSSSCLGSVRTIVHILTSGPCVTTNPRMELHWKAEVLDLAVDVAF